MDYNTFIDLFIINCRDNGLLQPSTIVFVTSYLEPKIRKVSKHMPNIIINDYNYSELIYEENNVSIVIQTDTIRFTKSYYNNWIKNYTKIENKYYIGLNENGLFLQNFINFRNNYISILEKQKRINLDNYEVKRYSPQVNIENYLYYCILNGNELNDYEYFPIDSNIDKILENKIKEIFKL